jgi:hypothetical protein
MIAASRKKTPAVRHRGVGAVLAMMFLVIFASLATAMAIVSQGNLRTADSHLKINRALAAAETGMQFLIYRLDQITPSITTRQGVIDATLANELWQTTALDFVDSLGGEFHNIQEPYISGGTVYLGPISIGPGSPTFEATMTPHPLAGEDYDSSYYQRPPYSEMTPAVSNANPLDARWVRVKVVAGDGAVGQRIYRSISMDFKIDKKIRFAILSKSRIMVGRNVMIDGRIGSRFMETHVTHGHPVQMESDFRGLDTSAGGLDEQLDLFKNTLAVNDIDGDNRILLGNPQEVDGLSDPEQYDIDGDGYIDDYDFFLGHYDANADGRVSAIELNADTNINAAQLLELIDTFGAATRTGYGDGFIDPDDRYAKIRGEVVLSAALQDWLDGAAHGVYQDYFEGTIHPDFGEAPLSFEAAAASVHQFEASDFDVSSFEALATGDMASQANGQFASHDPADPASPSMDLSGSHIEEVPFGATYPYDFYERPVYENMTFTNVKIPKGTNALFRNCRFIGVTFVETETSNTDPDFNYAGMQEADGSQKHPDRSVTINGTEYGDTKAISNNLRFDGCTFEGSIISDAPQEFTQARNKISFTGTTRFEVENSTHLSESEKQLYKRSTILAPQYSIEMGTFVAPHDSSETVQLSGTIVAGLLDMRGQIKVNGTILTTFEPQSDVGPVIGETSGQFNTTLGYFSSSAGDLEAELPTNGIGVIQVVYDPTLPLPDGILGPIEIRPVVATYFEGGAN